MENTKNEYKNSFNKKIGKTNYKVTVHFSKTSDETITDKINKKNLIATHKGISLVTIVADSFKSAKTTAKWEMELSDIAQGKSSKKEFLDAIENEIKEVVLT